jgi:hypothetical protein
MVDLLDEYKTYHVKLRGSKLDYLMSLVSLYSVASPALDCRSGDRTFEQSGGDFIAFLPRDSGIRGEEDRNLCLG